MASVNYAGIFLGAVGLSPFADIYGRRSLLLWTTTGIVLFCLLSAAAPSFHVFLLARFMAGFCEGPFVVAASFVTEHVSTENRGILANYVIGLSWGLGTTAVNLLAWLILPHYSWRVLLVVTAVPVMMNILQLYMLVESPRWLVSQGRVDEAFTALEYMAAGNGTVMPCSWLSISEVSGHESTPLTATEIPSGPISLFKRVFAEYVLLFTEARFLLLCAAALTWACQQFAYFAVVFFDNDILGATKHKTCQFDYAFDTFVGSSEIVGALMTIPLLDSPGWSPLIGGRVGKQVSFLFMSAVTLVFLANDTSPAWLWAYAARGFLAGSVGAMLIQSAELFDAHYRATGSGFLTSVGMLSTILAPYWVLSQHSQPVVLLGIAMVMGIGMLAALVLPETAQQELDKGSFEKLQGLPVMPSLPWLSNDDRNQARRHSV